MLASGLYTYLSSNRCFFLYIRFSSQLTSFTIATIGKHNLLTSSYFLIGKLMLPSDLHMCLSNNNLFVFHMISYPKATTGKDNLLARSYL